MRNQHYEISYFLYRQQFLLYLNYYTFLLYIYIFFILYVANFNNYENNIEVLNKLYLHIDVRTMIQLV
jgi:hypothetical protein